MLWFLSAVLIVTGGLSLFCAFGGAMKDGDEPKLVGPATWGGIAAIIAGFGIAGWLTFIFVVNQIAHH